MKIIIDTEFATRAELDSFIQSRFGTDEDKNLKHEIELTTEEAEKLSLSRDTKVHGVRVITK